MCYETNHTTPSTVYFDVLPALATATYHSQIPKKKRHFTKRCMYVD